MEADRVEKDIKKAYNDSIEVDQLFNLDYDTIMHRISDIKESNDSFIDRIGNQKDLILNIYKVIKEKKYKGNKIKSPADLNYVIHQYSEYYQGMLEYVTEIIQSLKKEEKTESEYKEIASKIAIVYDKDSTYIESLKKEEEVSFEDGIIYIESIIDLKKMIEKFYEDIESLSKACSLNNLYSRDYKNRILRALFMLVIESFHNFLAHIKTAIQGVLNEYKNIMNNDDMKLMSVPSNPKPVLI